MGAIKELRDKGYDVPLYPEEPQTDEEKEIQQRYHTVTGSAVNPVLREGNSDRRVAGPVKAYAQKNPHKMGLWSKASRTHVAHMTKGDFYSSEQSTTIMSPTKVTIELVDADGEITTLKESVELQAGEVIDTATLSVEELTKFYETEIAEAKSSDLLFSLVRFFLLLFNDLFTYMQLELTLFLINFMLINEALKSNHDEGFRSHFVWALRKSVFQSSI